MLRERFAVLADRDVAARVRGKLPALLSHPSGRPSLVTQDCEAWRVIHMPCGVAAVLADGSQSDSLAAVASRMTALATLEERLAAFSGSFLVVLQEGARCHVYPSVLPSIQVYWSPGSSIPIITDDAHDLAGELGARLDPAVLCLSLLPLGAPWPLSTASPWKGISRLGVGEKLVLLGERIKLERWWSLPDIVLDRPSVVEHLRSALPKAVADLCAGQSHIAADVSGGLDSTAVAYLASNAGVTLTAHHAQAEDAHNDDTFWACRAMGELGAEALVAASQAHTSFFSPVELTTIDEGEGPFVWSAGRQHLQRVAKHNQERGIRTHLTGFGGDELFTPMPAQLWSLWHQRGVSALPILRRSARRNRLSLARLLIQARDSTLYAEELARATVVSATDNGLGWGAGFTLPDWLTHTGRQAVFDHVAELAAGSITPLSPDRARHQALVSLAHAAELLRTITLRFGHGSVRWTSPFVQPSVFTAALLQDSASRIEDGYSKGLLRDSVAGIMPREYFDRGTKGEYSKELHEAMRLHRDALFSFFDNSALGSLGLIDPERLQVIVRSGLASTDQLHQLQATLETECWVRSVLATQEERFHL